MIEHPEFLVGVEKHGDGLAGSGGDLVVASVELDDVAQVDLAAGAQREV
ncbi:MAG: hypothetical protein ACO3LD_09440 [Luminiphilus sp.]